MKSAKLIIIPKVIPKGFRFSPVEEDERMIGRRGQMQGAKIVTNPDKNAKVKRIIIKVLVIELHIWLTD